MTNNKRAIALVFGLSVVIVGAMLLLTDPDPTPGVDAAHFEPGHSPDPFWSSASEAIPPRRFDSAAIPNYEGVESDDWDSLGPAGRVERTEALILKLREQIAASADEEEREILRDQAAQALSVARADFFSDPELVERYTQHEESFER